MIGKLIITFFSAKVESVCVRRILLITELGKLGPPFENWDQCSPYL